MTAINSTEWADKEFPGEGLELPTDAERQRADDIVAEWNQRWSEHHPPIARVHPDIGEEGLANYVAGTPTNRAYLRAQLRRWWRKQGRPALLATSCLRVGTDTASRVAGIGISVLRRPRAPVWGDVAPRQLPGAGALTLRGSDGGQ